MGVEQIILWIVGGAAALLLLALGWRRLLDNPHGTLRAGFVWQLTRAYVRLVHRLRVEGRENIPGVKHPGPMVIVSNHGAGVDPLLIQSVCNFDIRFMMAADMMVKWMRPLLRWARVIPVDRAGGDMRAARAAIRVLKDGGVIGIFPEGRLIREDGEIGPFLPGVGLMIRRSGAKVLPVVIDGTPNVPSAWGSLWRPSRARVRFLPMMRFDVDHVDASEIAEQIRARMQSAVSAPAPDPARKEDQVTLDRAPNSNAVS